MPIKQATVTKKLILPETLPGVEPGEWVEIIAIETSEIRRKTLDTALQISVGASGVRELGVQAFAFRAALMREIVLAWSDPEPVTPENLGMMHPDIQDWIADEWNALTKARTPEEKKTLPLELQPASDPETAPGPESSTIFSKAAG